MSHKWAKSVHSQIEAVFWAIRAFHQSKLQNPNGIRSIGVWKVYRREAHLFADFFISKGQVNILDPDQTVRTMAQYLKEKLHYNVAKRNSRQTFETSLSAIGKVAYAINNYIRLHELDYKSLDIELLRCQFYSLSKKLLPMSSRVFDSRAYEDPLKIIENIDDPIYQLQALMQYEGGCRCEGVGAPRQQKIKNPLTAQSLKGITPDPVTGKLVGCVVTCEKGGKQTLHYISETTYRRLERFIESNGKLESDYYGYIEAINKAAKKTGQFAPGRGSHGLKHNFAEERYHECVHHNLTHEEAAQQTSIEMAHFRLRETIIYTRGHKK